MSTKVKTLLAFPKARIAALVLYLYENGGRWDRSPLARRGRPVAEVKKTFRLDRQALSRDLAVIKESGWEVRYQGKGRNRTLYVTTTYDLIRMQDKA